MKIISLLLILIQLIGISISIQKEELEYYYKDYIKMLGYKLEEHEVITEDGYKLFLWHIIKSNSYEKTKVAYIQPGFVCTAWVFFQLEKNSLPILLIEQGYDVWIGNNRGTIFSMGHISKDSQNLVGDYWDYSMDENVFYDLPASINYVKKITKTEKINYIGHSQGTTLFYMLYMHDPSYIESSINKFVSLGSVPNIAYAEFFPIQILDKIYGLLEMSQPLTKALIFDEGKRKMLSDICQKFPIICKNVFETSSSLEPTNRVQYETIFPFLYYYPAGTNSNTMLHWSQIHQEKKLVYFNPDYPTTKEAKPYDSNVIKNWKIKSFIQRSDCDTFSSYDDVTEFYEAVEDKSLILLVDTPNYGHTDDLAASSAIEDVYKPLINFLEE